MDIARTNVKTARSSPVSKLFSNTPMPGQKYSSVLVKQLENVRRLNYSDAPDAMGTVEAAKLHLQRFRFLGASGQKVRHFRPRKNFCRKAQITSLAALHKSRG